MMKKGKLIFHLGHSAGFYSEFNNMVLAILYCQRNNLEFCLYSSDANFRFAKGWNDFFLPFCHETHNPIHHYINHRFNAPKGGKRKWLYDFYKFFHPQNYLTSELWFNIRHIDHIELTTIETQRLCSPILNNIYRFNPITLKKIEAYTSQIDLPPKYISFHIRGGDKTSEHEILSIEHYIALAERKTSIRSVFVYTDDYGFFEALCKQYPTWHFITLISSEDRGYFHNDFLKLDLRTRTQKILKMFASMELISRSELAFCTFSSNIGMFLGMRMGDRAVGVDMDKWMIW